MSFNISKDGRQLLTSEKINRSCFSTNISKNCRCNENISDLEGSSASSMGRNHIDQEQSFKYNKFPWPCGKVPRIVKLQWLFLFLPTLLAILTSVSF